MCSIVENPTSKVRIVLVSFALYHKGYSNVENLTSKKILRSAFSVISVYDHHNKDTSFSTLMFGFDVSVH